MGIKTFQNVVIWVIQKINIYSTLRVIFHSKIQRLYSLYMFWRMGNKTLFFTFDDHFGNTGLLYEPLYGFYSTNVASLRMYMLSKQNRKKSQICLILTYLPIYALDMKFWQQFWKRDLTKKVSGNILFPQIYSNPHIKTGQEKKNLLKFLLFNVAPSGGTRIFKVGKGGWE